MGDLFNPSQSNAISTLSQKLSEATERLAPASPDFIASSIIKLAGAGMAYPPSLDKHRAGELYAFALKGVPREAIKAGIVKIMMAEVKDASRDFIPTPPALAAICKAEAIELYRNRDRIRLSLESMQRGDRPPPSEAERANVRAMVERVKQNAAAIREERNEALYEKPEEDLNRLFRNKLPPDPRPQAGKWSDEEWFSQQRENENGEEKSSRESSNFDSAAGGPEGHQERD